MFYLYLKNEFFLVQFYWEIEALTDAVVLQTKHVRTTDEDL